MAHILMVEDNPANAAVYAEFLKQQGHVVDLVDTGRGAALYLEDRQPELLLLDLKLPDMQGMEIIEKLSVWFRQMPTIVLTGNGSILAATESMRAGAVDFLMKPCSAENLTKAVALGLKRGKETGHQTEGEPGSNNPSARRISPRNSEASGFLGKSPVMENVFSLIHAAGKSTASVFITGESGTGKELCARAIHEASARKDGSFIALNCAAIPKDLIESEIFGHRKGAFTGAVENREGAASLANGGTLFLDELCEMDLDLQAKLLRFIQTGTYKPVGDGTDRTTDIRFVCATNRDPAEEVRAGRFREDLYYRLFVVPIAMPPLREREEDVALLADRFLEEASRIEGKSFRGFDADARQVLCSYSWPGNVRQLENAIRTVVVLNDADQVTASMLSGLASLSSAPTPTAPDKPASPDPSGMAFSPELPAEEGLKDETVPTDWLIRPFEEIEIMAIKATIDHFGGNITRASRSLNISTSTIYRKLKAREQPSGATEA